MTETALSFKHIKVTAKPINVPDNVIPAGLATVDFQKLAREAEASPETAILKLEKHLEKYPKVGMLYNLLTAAYHHAGREKDSEALIEKGYQNCPQYLFIKMSYARLCIKRKQMDKIPEIFNQKFDLTELYPDRKLFHESEAINFYGLMGEHYVYSKDLKKAWACYDYVKSIDPSDPVVEHLHRIIMVHSIPKWKAYGIIAIIIIVVLALIALIIWGITKLF